MKRFVWIGLLLGGWIVYAWGRGPVMQDVYDQAAREGVELPPMAEGDSFPGEGSLRARIHKQDLLIAMLGVESLLSSMQDGGGYQTWTPSKAVDKMLPILNIADAPLPGEPELPKFIASFTYVKDRVTGPWQIVLTPDDAAGVIRVKAYGDDTQTPLETKELYVSPYG